LPPVLAQAERDARQSRALRFPVVQGRSSYTTLEGEEFIQLVDIDVHVDILPLRGLCIAVTWPPWQLALEVGAAQVTSFNDTSAGTRTDSFSIDSGRAACARRPMSDL